MAVISEPITFGITVTFLIQFFQFSYNVSELTHFSLSFSFTLCLAGTSKSTIRQGLFFFLFFFFCLSPSDCLAKSRWSVCIPIHYYHYYYYYYYYHHFTEILVQIICQNTWYQISPTASLQRGKTSTTHDLSITLNHLIGEAPVLEVWRMGRNSFIDITPRSTLNWNGSCAYWSNRTFY